MKNFTVYFLMLLSALALMSAESGAVGPLDLTQYNVIRERPSKGVAGQMPLGNGDIAAGIYAIEDGDLYLLLSKNDAFTYNGDLLKTGRVRFSLDPNPFAKDKPFIQTLDLVTGSIRIEADDVRLWIWADANRPVYHVQVHSPREIFVTAAPEFWKRFDDCKHNCSREPIEEREKLIGKAPIGMRTDVDGGAVVAQSYNVFRFLMTCQSRGRV
jgi:hypothetical protein